MTPPSSGLRLLRAMLESSLGANSLYLILGNVFNTGFGFFFWMIAARLYQPPDVGLGAAAFSTIGLLAMLSTLGLDVALVRFLPEAPDPRRLVGSSLLIAGSAACVACAVFLAGLRLWSPALLPLRPDALFVGSFATSAVCTTFLALTGGVFVAGRHALFVAVQAALFGVIKTAAAIAMAPIGDAAALVGAWGIGTLVTAVVSVRVLLPRVAAGEISLRFAVDPVAVREMAGFAFANYVTVTLNAAPMYLLPLLIVNLAGPEAGAHYYVAASVSSLLGMIPTAVGLSLFAHGSSDTGGVVALAAQSIRLSLWLLAPALALTWLLGGRLLLLFGRSYSLAGTHLLWLLALATVPLTVNALFFSVRRVQRRMGDVVLGLVWILIVTLVMSTVLLPRIGLVGVGVTWCAAQGSLAAVVVARYARRWRRGFLHGAPV